MNCGNFCIIKSERLEITSNMRKNTNSVDASGKKGNLSGLVGLFVHPFSLTCNNGHVNYILLFIQHNLLYMGIHPT